MNMQQQMMLAAATGGGGVPNPLAGRNPLEFLTLCGGDSVDPLADLHEIGAGEAKALGAKSNKKHYLRICFHSASKLASNRFGGCDPYVHATIGAGANLLEFRTQTLKKSANPVWEEVWECEIEIGLHTNAVIRVYSDEMGYDTVLGATSLVIPQMATPVKRETIKLAGVPSVGFFRKEKPDSSVTVLFQVTNSLKHAPDLVQIGDMDDLDLESRDLNIAIDLRRFRMKKPAKTDDRLIMVVGLVDVQKASAAAEEKAAQEGDGASKAKKDEGHAAEEDEDNGTQVRASPEIIIKANGREAGWDNGGKDGFEVSWRQLMNRCDMLQHVISFTLQELQPDGGRFIRGSWEEPLSSLVDSVALSQEPIHCWIQLKDNIGVNAGKALIELDVFESERHRLPPVLSVDELPVRAGAPPLHDREKPCEYFVHLYGDFFPQIDKPGFFSSAPGPLDPNWGCDPFVRISMDGPKVLSKAFTCQRRRVIWTEPVRIKTKIGNTRAKIELLDGDAGLFSSSENLLGECTIYNLKPGHNNWLHFLGGALDAKHKDVSLAMIKGGSVGPASTYRGSLCVHFSTKAKPSANQWPPHIPRLRGYGTAQLVVKMYRGLYLQELAPPPGAGPRKCRLLIQVPSAGLPVRLTKREVDQLPKYTRLQDPGCGPVKPLNPNLLCFPGEITDGGMLNFLVGDEDRRRARMRKSCFGMCKPSDYEEFDEDDDPSRPLFYVERKSPPFYILPGVTKAFMYLIFDDDEVEQQGDGEFVPRIFGVMDLLDPSSDKLKLGPETMSRGSMLATDEPQKLTEHEEFELRQIARDKQKQLLLRSRPQWERLRWDMSVIMPPDSAIFETGVVGRVLCCAKLDEEVDPVAWDELENLEERALEGAKADKEDKSQGVKPMPVASDAEDVELQFDAEKEQVENAGAGGAAQPRDSIELAQREFSIATVRSKRRKPEKQDVLPKTLQSTGAWCGPGLKQLQTEGSFGCEVKYKRKALSDMYTVYCHVDVLCGRNFPAMDANGLCDPTWIVQVQNQQSVSLKVPASLNPTYVQRVVIPYEVYIPPSYSANSDGFRKRVGNVNGHLQLEPDPNNPLPPVRLLIRDRDEGNALLMIPDTFQEIATVANLQPVNLDEASMHLWNTHVPVARPESYDSPSSYVPPLEKGQLRLDEAHTPLWQRLDIQQDGLTLARLETQKGWKGKPMVLWSAGYSLQPGAHLMYREWRFEYDGGLDGKPPENMVSELLEDEQLDLCDMVATRTIAAGEVFTFDYTQNGRAKVAGYDRWVSNFRPMKNWVPVEGQEKNLDPTPVIKIDTGEFKYYRTTLDMLGLRRLRPDVKYGLNLRIQSFWKTPLDVEADDSELPTINLKGVTPPTEEWQALADKVRGVMRLVLTRDEDDAAKQEVEQKKAKAQAALSPTGKTLGSMMSSDTISLASSVATDVGIDEFLGIRVRCPVYSAPIIQYLQKHWMQSGAGIESLKLVRPGEEMKFALLPSIAFCLQSNVGLGDFGALSLSLQDYAGPDHPKGCWFEQIADKMDALPIQYQGLAPMKHVHCDPKATIVYVDVFAEKEGNLWWDVDARMGRNLRSQCLFRIDDHNQYLNPADYFLNAPEYLDDEFEKQPSLYVNRKQTTPYPDGKTVLEISLQPFYDWSMNNSGAGDSKPAVTELYLNAAPFWDQELQAFKADFVHIVPHVTGPGKTKQVPRVIHWTTGRLSRLMRAYGWRYKSRYHRPCQIQAVIGGVTRNLIAPKQAEEEDESDSDPDEVDASAKEDDLKEKQQEAMKRSMTNTKSAGMEDSKKQLERLRRGEGRSAQASNEERRRFHQWTFMRPVGHLIHEHDRDSKILGRFRMVSYVDEEPVEWHQENYETLKQTEPDLVAATETEVITTPRDPDSKLKKRTYPQISNNFVTIKYDLKTNGRILRAQVIWAAPAHRVVFKNAGTLLYVLKILEGENEGNHIEVTTPNFDLRFAYETCLYVRKTMLERWRTLERKINENTKKLKENDAGKLLSKKKKKKGHKEEEADLEPNGFSLSIPVRENEFCMRLVRRYGLSIFDREQTESWYRKYLGEVFPDVFSGMGKVDKDDSTLIRKDGSKKDPYKEKFMAHSMNLRRSLVVGETMDFVGELKGHVSLEEVPQDQLDFNRDSEDFFQSIPQPLKIPLNRFWQTDTLMAHVYVLTARNLVEATGSVNPYLSASSTGANPQSFVSQQRNGYGRHNPDFYEHFALPVQIPGADTINLKVMNESALGAPTIIGEVDIDVEDRWQAVIQKNLTQLTSVEWLTKHLANEGVDEESGEKLRPHLAPGKPFPVEFADLFHIDPDSKLRTPAGSIRYWVDLVPSEEPYTDYDVAAARQGADFEIRVTVWNVKGVTIFMDDGQRNDLIVRGTLVVRSVDGTVTRFTRDTDCHKFSNSDANFNWRWKFTVNCPAASCSLVLQLLDSDSLTDPEPIYDPEVIPLDHHLRLAYTNLRTATKPEAAIMGEAKTKVVFDSWPSDAPKPVDVRCCPCCNTTREPTPAVLMCDIQVLPQEYADKHPVGEGRDAPQALPDPVGRVTWQTALRDPWLLTKVLLGPQKVMYCKWLCGCTCGATCVLAVFGVLFFVTQIMGSGGLNIVGPGS